MLALFSRFFSEKALQWRQSISVTPTTGGFVHVAPRVWAVDYNAPFNYVSQGTIYYHAEVRASVGSCLAEYFLPTPWLTWGALIPLILTDFEHLVRDANRLTTNLHPVLAVLADTVREHIPRLDYTERAELSADAYVLYPRPLNEDAQLQSQVGFSFLGHVREAVEHAGGRVEGIVELPRFTSRLRSAGVALPEELYAVRCRIFVPETITTRRYELQV